MSLPHAERQIQKFQLLVVPRTVATGSLHTRKIIKICIFHFTVEEDMSFRKFFAFLKAHKDVCPGA